MGFKKFLILINLAFLLLSNSLNLSAQNIRKYNKLTQQDGLLSNRVTAIAEDESGRIWLGTNDGISLYDGDQITACPRTSNDSIFQPGKIIEIKAFKHKMVIAGDNGIYEYDFSTNKYAVLIKSDQFNTSKGLASDVRGLIILCDNNLYRLTMEKLIKIKKNIYFNKIQVDAEGNLWGATFTTVVKCDNIGNQLSDFKFAENFDNDLLITSFYCDSKGLLWAGTKRHGIFRYDPVQDKFKLQLPNPGQIQNVCSMAEDDSGRLWIGHNRGIAVFDYINQYVEYRMLIENFENELNTTVCSIFKSSIGDMVLGTYFNGGFYLSKNDAWLNFLHVTNPDRASGIVVNNMLMSSKKELWVATNTIGINVYNEKLQITKRFSHQNSSINDNIISLCEDQAGNIWAGSESNGLYCLIDQGNQIKHYLYNKNDKSSISNNRIFSIRNLNKDSLLIGTDGYINVYDKKQDRFSILLATSSTVNDIIVKDQQIWVCCLNEIICYDRLKKTKKIYTKKHANSARVQFHSMLFDGEKIILGTKNDYLYYIGKENILLPYPGSNIVKSQINGLQKDTQGRYWLSTANGLYCVEKDHSIKNIDVMWGLNTTWFNERSSYVYDNILYFGSVNGICYFKTPQFAQQSLVKPNLYFSDFKIFNVSQLKNVAYFEKSINETDEIELAYNQNMISIEVNQVNFDHQSRKNYRTFYKLEGSDNRWYELSSGSGNINFTSLKPGSYRLLVKLEDLNHKTLSSKALKITIKPHFLLNNIMLLIYTILLLYAVLELRKFIKRRHLEILKIKLSAVEKTKLEELNKSKLDFFTYMSHELKTPLAIIMAIQEDLFSNHKIENIKEYEISQKNIKRLTFLISQLMEFREIETSDLPLQTSYADLIAFCNNIFSVFTPLLERKNISYEFNCFKQELMVNMDFDKLEKIISNLLSNAFKNCEVNGNIIMEISESVVPQKVNISVRNTGSFIPQEQIQMIFQPYFRQKSTGDYYDNNGIGLALVIGLTKRLNAEIKVESSIKDGTRFTLCLPINTKVNSITENQDLNLNSTMELINDVLYSDPVNVNLQSNTQGHTHKVLLVEDHSELADLFKNKLKALYHVVITHNGKEALDYIRSQQVDLVISDIMMPVMDGYELCDHLKSNPKTKHIPVILMTSYDNIQNKIKSYELSADGYINKPFSTSELLAKISSLLKNKATLRNYYSHQEPLRLKEEANSQEESFILKVQQIIVDNISSNDFSVNQLAHKMRISRTQLYLQVKKTTEISPTDFIIKVKLDYGKSLLKKQSLSISEIAYKLGYSNSNYFSKQFKDFFGLTPSQYRKSKQENGV
ncbi:Signal transduction histidine kinase [Pedobacter sp. ok626]|uniref:hybrid sensor histidine kinase/response regulator transcription factor n=1 Tax=Pedobacter sp. ok626 TaxID=1761882 RepID=UPI00088D91B7|nr:hybrid sensor histidine kinase/response regulator transcription factor [Pedobacter sp. ok626]SDK56358.1 Signal transduction histidine kinase [Pedobacter sp. ok626]